MLLAMFPHRGEAAAGGRQAAETAPVSYAEGDSPG